MKKVSLVLIGAVTVLAIMLAVGTTLAATVSIEVTEVITTEGCSAGDMQWILGLVEWSGGTGGYGKQEWSLSVEGGGLLGIGVSENAALPPAMSHMLSVQHWLANDLAPGTVLKVDYAMTVDTDVATDTVYYVCGNTDFWRPATEVVAEVSAPEVAISGPDMVAMPDDAVVGTFTTTTPLYFAPEVSAASSYIMNAGQSLWVFGMDEAGTFYQVLLSGHTYWVPVANMGPTFDDTWNGVPLPTTVVE